MDGHGWLDELDQISQQFALRHFTVSTKDAMICHNFFHFKTDRKPVYALNSVHIGLHQQVKEKLDE